MSPGAIYHVTASRGSREHQRLPHIWSGAEIVMWSRGEEEAPRFADQILQSSQKSRGSKPNRPEEQLWKYRSTQGLWESQGSARLSRATVTWAKAWKRRADKATVSATTSWYLCLGRHQGWELKNGGLESTGHSRKERTLKNLLVLLALDFLCQAKNFGAWVWFLETVGEQRRGAMGTAPIGNPWTEDTSSAKLLDC